MEQNDYTIRPALHSSDVRYRGQDFSPKRRKAIQRSLRTLHNLELMASTIYAFQITRKPGQRNRRLIAALCNEMTHYQDFGVKLLEYGFRPFKLRWTHWLVGFAIGFTSRILGEKTILKTGIWVEKKAVHHYQSLLDTVDWDEETRKIIQKDRQDEVIHIRHWETLLRRKTAE